MLKHIYVVYSKISFSLYMCLVLNNALVKLCSIDRCSVHLSTSDSLTQLVQTYVDKSLLYICSEQFTPDDADVYCFEITGTDSIDLSSVPLQNASIQLPIYDYNYNCSGTEESLCDCPTTEMEQCESNQVSEVVCREPGMYFNL